MQGVAAGRRKLRAAGFHVTKRRVFEGNALFDTTRGSLRRSGQLLRVREVGRSGILTYKGPESEGKYKDREELEVDVSDPPRLAEILQRLGLSTGFRYEKYRTEYQRSHESGVATLDETPIGVYLELEGSRRWIDRSARLLDFSETDYITSSYYGLYADWCRDRGIQPTHMTFTR